MRWHPEPTDDIWKLAHLAMVEGLGKRLRLSCDQCQHWVMAEVRGFAEQHGLDMRTPMLTISRALKLQPLRTCAQCRISLVQAGVRALCSIDLHVEAEHTLRVIDNFDTDRAADLLYFL